MGAAHGKFLRRKLPCGFSVSDSEEGTTNRVAPDTNVPYSEITLGVLQFSKQLVDTLNQLPVNFIIIDRERNCIVWASDRYCAATGSTLEAVMGRDLSKDSQSVREQQLSMLSAFRDGRRVEFSEEKVIYPEGKPTCALVRWLPIIVENRMALLATTVFTPKPQDGEAFRTTEALKRASAMVTVYTERHQMVVCNVKARTCLDQVLGPSVAQGFLPHVADQTLVAHIAAELRAGRKLTQRVVTKGQHPRTHLLHGSQIYDPTNGDQLFLISEDDVTKQAKVEALLQGMMEALAQMDLEEAELLRDQFIAEHEQETPEAYPSGALAAHQSIFQIIDHLKSFRPYLPDAIFVTPEDRCEEDLHADLVYSSDSSSEAGSQGAPVAPRPKPQQFGDSGKEGKTAARPHRALSMGGAMAFPKLVRPWSPAGPRKEPSVTVLRGHTHGRPSHSALCIERCDPAQSSLNTARAHAYVPPLQRSGSSDFSLSPRAPGLGRSATARSTSSTPHRLANPGDMQLHLRWVTVLVTNLTNFSRFVEEHDSAGVALFLSDLTGLVERCADDARGKVLSIQGDHVVVAWNASQAVMQPNMKACTCALDVQRDFAAALAPRWAGAFPALSLQIAIGSAKLLVGNAGCDRKKSFQVLGQDLKDILQLPAVCSVAGAPILLTERVARDVVLPLVARPAWKSRIQNAVHTLYHLVGSVQDGADDEWMYNIQALEKKKETCLGAYMKGWDCLWGGAEAGVDKALEHFGQMAAGCRVDEQLLHLMAVIKEHRRLPIPTLPPPHTRQFGAWLPRYEPQGP